MRSVKGVVQSPFSLQSPAPSSQLVPCYVLYFIIQGHNVVYIPDIFFTHDVHIFTSSALLFHRCFPYYSLHSQICVPLLSSLQHTPNIWLVSLSQDMILSCRHTSTPSTAFFPPNCSTNFVVHTGKVLLSANTHLCHL